jgi:hypothetical protein
MQYREMTEHEQEEYWKKPFSLKPWLGFHSYKLPVQLRMVDEEEPKPNERAAVTRVPFPDPDIRALFRRYFTNADYVAKFVEFNALEHRKGEDFFSMDKALFHCCLYENFGDEFLPSFMPFIQKLAVSAEESDQRVAAELIFGAIRGSRFW